MQSLITAPLSLLISLSVLSGWFISDFRFYDVVQVALFAAQSSSANIVNEIMMVPATTTPDIPTNWFSGNTSNMSSHLPVTQARSDDKENNIAQGRILGDSVSSNDL